MSENNLAFNNPFCPLPFIHQHVNTKKESKVCCFAGEDGYVTTDMDFNADGYKFVRDDILSNKWPSQCSSCKLKEEQKLISPRQNAVRDLYLKHKNLVDSQIELYKKGHDLQPYYYDLRFSNLCNLACQTCSASNSSTIAKTLKNPDVFLSYEPDMDINPNAVKVYLAGGEPFLIKKFVDFLNKIENTDCEIVVNTNGTIITSGLLIALKRFKTVSITLSLDGYGKLNDKIRIGSNWDQIVKNLQTFKDNGFLIHVNTVIQKDNINELYELGLFLDENGITKWSMYELDDPEEFVWTHAQIDVEKVRKVLELKIVKKNLELTTLINKILK